MIREKLIKFAAVVLFVGAAIAAEAKDYKRLSFETLAAREYQPVAPEDSENKVVRNDKEYLERYVLDNVLALDGKSVEIAGYMLPISVRGEKVDEFLLLPNTGACCFGQMPAFNAFVYARARKGVNLFDNIPIRIRGKLTVEEVWQSGFFSHLYYLDVDDLEIGFGSSPSAPVIRP